MLAKYCMCVPMCVFFFFLHKPAYLRFRLHLRRRRRRHQFHHRRHLLGQSWARWDNYPWKVKYVFKIGRRQMSLSSQEGFIEENQALPCCSSSQDSPVCHQENHQCQCLAHRGIHCQPSRLHTAKMWTFTYVLHPCLKAVLYVSEISREELVQRWETLRAKWCHEPHFWKGTNLEKPGQLH